MYEQSFQELNFIVPCMLTVLQRNDLAASGLEVVLTQAIYAVVGAVALEKGGAVANQVARDSILKPLGFDVGMPRETL